MKVIFRWVQNCHLSSRTWISLSVIYWNTDTLEPKMYTWRIFASSLSRFYYIPWTRHFSFFYPKFRRLMSYQAHLQFSETEDFIFLDILTKPKACNNLFLRYPLLILTQMGTCLGPNPNSNGYISE